jgi:hypothetical protein
LSAPATVSLVGQKFARHIADALCLEGFEVAVGITVASTRPHIAVVAGRNGVLKTAIGELGLLTGGRAPSLKPGSPTTR